MVVKFVIVQMDAMDTNVLEMQIVTDVIVMDVTTVMDAMAVTLEMWIVVIVIVDLFYLFYMKVI